MSRRYLPDPDALATALAGRVDTLEHQITQTSTDVATLARGVGDLTTQIRDLTTILTPPTNRQHPPNPGQDPAAPAHDLTSTGTDPDDDGDGQEEVEGQPDWFTVTDPGVAQAILGTLTTWVQDVTTHYGLTLPSVCWALHPDVVADLLALHSERAGAYTGPRPTPVSEWLTRWLPATTERIHTALRACASERGHVHDGLTYDTTGFDPLSAGAWWALERHLPAPTAFALTRLT